MPLACDLLHTIFKKKNKSKSSNISSCGCVYAAYTDACIHSRNYTKEGLAGICVMCWVDKKKESREETKKSDSFIVSNSCEHDGEKKGFWTFRTETTYIHTISKNDFCAHCCGLLHYPFDLPALNVQFRIEQLSNRAFSCIEPKKRVYLACKNWVRWNSL